MHTDKLNEKKKLEKLIELFGEIAIEWMNVSAKNNA